MKQHIYHYKYIGSSICMLYNSVLFEKIVLVRLAKQALPIEMM